MTTTSHSKPRIGFLGLGTMGSLMAMNIAKSGFPLTVWNRTSSKTEPFQQLGIKIGKGPAQIAAEVDVVITMVSGSSDVEEIVTGPDGVADGIRANSVFIDMSTVTPTASRKIAAAVAAKQAEFLDAPVVGSIGPATEGALVILVGGLPTTFERCRGILSSIGKTIIHAGGVGMGSTLKLATNMMLSHLMAGLSEALLMVEKAGLDPKKYLEVIDASTFHSPWYHAKAAGILNRDFSSHFALKHMQKDVRMMGELADELSLTLPVTKAIEQLFSQSAQAGKGELDYSAIFSTLEEVSQSEDTQKIKENA